MDAPDRRRFRSGALLLALAATTGCGFQQCPEMEESTASSAALTLSWPAGDASGGDGAALPPRSAAVSTVDTEMFVGGACNLESDAGTKETTADPSSPSGADPSPSRPCVFVAPESEDATVAATTLVFDAPAQPGTYRLEDLHARAGEGPLRGTLTVHTIVLPCDDGTCGTLEADLTIDSGGQDPAISGTAKLSLDHHPASSGCDTGSGPDLPPILPGAQGW